MNRTLVLIALAGTLSAVAAFGQNPATNSSTTPPAVSTGSADSKTSAAPVPGKNSFTMKEARSRLHAHGYSHAKDLVKDDQGIWRGTATKDGKQVNVGVDYQGNITEQ